MNDFIPGFLRGRKWGLQGEFPLAVRSEQTSITADPISAPVLMHVLSDPFIARSPRNAFILAAVMIGTAIAWHAGARLSAAVGVWNQLLLTQIPRPTEPQAGQTQMHTAGGRKADHHDDQDEEGEAPEEPQLEYIPLVPAAQPQPLAV